MKLKQQKSIQCLYSFFCDDLYTLRLPPSLQIITENIYLLKLIQATKIHALNSISTLTSEGSQLFQMCSLPIHLYRLCLVETVFLLWLSSAPLSGNSIIISTGSSPSSANTFLREHAVGVLFGWCSIGNSINTNGLSSSLDLICLVELRLFASSLVVG